MAEQLEELLNNQKGQKPKYRFVVINNDTFEEQYSTIISVKNLYALLSSILLILSLIIVCVLVFTPLKRLIPGYGDNASNTAVMKLYKELEAMEETIDVQSTYLNGFKNMLTAGEEDDQSASVVTPPQSNSEILASSTQTGLNPSILTFITPVSGIISAGFDPKIKHLGIDVLAPKNTPILSTLDGNVIHAAWNMETGNTIGIQHANNMISFYKHNSVLLKKEGAHVKGGEVIAIIGNTGTLSSGPHLHFELWQNGIPLDPKNYITFE